MPSIQFAAANATHQNNVDGLLEVLFCPEDQWSHILQRF